MKYNAFISYSHSSDAAIAPALQSALHAFAKPWTRMRALHVFRDQTSLAASPELWPAIESALKESQHLLLLASPAAAQSRWVAREIEWWLTHRSANTMFVLLTDGELVWDEDARDFDWERTDCLPRDVLRHRLAGEPLWVDLRWCRSQEQMSLRNVRFRSAVLDIAAPLHGKDKDALDGEDVRAFARTQRIRWGAVTVLGVLAVLASAFAVFAVRQRDEAVRQNVIAQAGRLTAQADLLLERDGTAETSAMLAAEALSMLYRIGERSVETDLTVRRALERLPQFVRALDFTAADVELDPTGSVLSSGSRGSNIRAWRLPDVAPAGCDDGPMHRLADADSLNVNRSLVARSANAAWCVVLVNPQAQTSDDAVLERWTASPLRRVDSFHTTLSFSDAVFVSDDGDLLVFAPMGADRAKSDARLRLLRRSRDSVLLRLHDEDFFGFSPDHRHFATSTGLWRLADDPAAAPMQLLRWGGPIFRVVFSRSGAFLAAASDTLLEVWDVEHRLRVRGGAARDVFPRAIRDDGRYLVNRKGDTTSILDAYDFAVLAQLPFGSLGAAFATRDPTIVAEPAPGSGAPMRVLRIPSAGAAITGAELPRGARPHAVAMSNDVVRVLYSTDSLTLLSQWSTTREQWRDEFVRRRARKVLMSADQSVFATVHDSSVTVARLDGSSAPVDLPLPGIPSLETLGIGGEYLAISVSDTMHVFAVATRRHWRVPLPAGTLDLNVSADGAFAAALVEGTEYNRVGLSYTVVRWAMTTAERVLPAPDSILLRNMERAPPLRCLINADGRTLVVRGTRMAFGERPTPRTATSPRNVAPSDTTTVSDQCGVDVRTSRRLQVSGRSVEVSDNGTGATLTRIEQPRSVAKAAVSPDSRRLVTIDDRGGMRLFALDVPSLIRQVCARAPDPVPAELWASITRASGNEQRQRDACGRVPSTTQR